MKEVGEARSATSGIRDITPDGTITSGVTPQTINTLISGSDVSGLRVEHAEIGRTDSSTHSHTHTHNHTHFHGMPVSVPTASSAYVSSTSQSGGAVSASARTSAAFGELKKGVPSVLLPQVLNFRQFVMVETPSLSQAEDKDEKEVKANVTAPSHSTLSRRAYLEQIKESLGSSLTPTAVLTPLEDFVLFGRGGVGKSWLAMKYAHEQHAAGQYQLIGWVDCNKNIDSEFERLAKRWFDWGEEKPAVGEINWAERLYTSLSKVSSWLLIFDDAKDSKSVSHYLPQENHQYLSSQPGMRHHALVTSRYHGWRDSCIRVGGLSLCEIQQLAEQRGIQEEVSQYQQLAEALGFHTLAISQALLYIQCESQYEEMDIATYLQRLEARPEDIFVQSHHEEIDSHPETAYQRNVLESLALSLEACLKQLVKVSPAHRSLAEHVFIALGYLGEQSIPKHLLDSLAEDVPSPSLSSDNISEPSGGGGADNATEGHSSTYTALSSQLSMPPSSLSPQSVCRKVHRALIDYGIVDYDKHTGHYRLHQLMHLTLSLRYCAPDNPEKRAEQLRYLEASCCKVFTYAPYHTDAENQPSVEAQASMAILIRHIEQQWPEPVYRAPDAVLKACHHDEECTITLLLRMSQLLCYYYSDIAGSSQWIEKAFSRLEACEARSIDLSRELKAAVYLHWVSLPSERGTRRLADDIVRAHLAKVWQLYGGSVLYDNLFINTRDTPILTSIESVIVLRRWLWVARLSFVNEKRYLKFCLRWLEVRLAEGAIHSRDMIQRCEYELLQTRAMLHAYLVTKDSGSTETRLLEKHVLESTMGGLPYIESLCRLADSCVRARKYKEAASFCEKARALLVSNPSPAAAMEYVGVSYQLACCYEAVEHVSEMTDVLTEIFAFIKAHHRAMAARNAKTDQYIAHMAAEVGDVNVLSYLHQQGHNCLTPVDANTETPLHIAVRHKQVSTITWLIEHRHCDSDLNIQNRRGETVLMLAATYGYDGCEGAFHLLLEAGASLEKTSEHWVDILLGVVGRNSAILTRLVALGLDVNKPRDKDGTTPLMGAAQCGHLEAVKILLAHGADVNAVNTDGKSALMFAAESGCTQTVALLIEHQAQVDLRDDTGETALSRAAARGCIDVARQLVAAGADIDISDKDGRTPLYWACLNMQEAMITYLLEAGADIHANTYGGLAEYYFHGQNVEQAMGYYRQAIALAPDKFQYYHNAACCADILGEHEEAEAYFLKGIELAPRSELYAVYAYFLYRRENYADALERVAQSSIANITVPLLYRKIEADILAEPMRGFILERGEVTLSSKVLCYYVECLCYLGMAQHEKLGEALAAWQHSSTQSDDETEQALFTVTQAWIEKTVKVGSSALLRYVECLSYLAMAQYEKLGEALAAWQHSSTQSDDETEQALFTVTQAWIEKTVKVESSVLLRDEGSLERGTSESIQPDVTDSVWPSGEPLLPVVAPSELGCHIRVPFA